MNNIFNTFKNVSRQQMINVFMITISINMYVQNETISKKWKQMDVREIELKKQYNSFQNMVNDKEWLVSVEEEIREADSQPYPSSSANGNNNLLSWLMPWRWLFGSVKSNQDIKVLSNTNQESLYHDNNDDGILRQAIKERLASNKSIRIDDDITITE